MTLYMALYVNASIGPCLYTPSTLTSSVTETRTTSADSAASWSSSSSSWHHGDLQTHDVRRYAQFPGEVFGALALAMKPLTRLLGVSDVFFFYAGTLVMGQFQR
jgi:hypothetical protein